jgi:hypothetical protein
MDGTVLMRRAYLTEVHIDNTTIEDAQLDSVVTSASTFIDAHIMNNK